MKESGGMGSSGRELNPSSFEAVRLLVVGETGIGKSTLIQLLTTSKANVPVPHTIGCSCEVLVSHTTQKIEHSKAEMRQRS